MKGFKKKMLLLSGLFLISWLLFAQSCMSFRKSDADEKKEFAKDHVTLHTATIESGRKAYTLCHYRQRFLTHSFFYSWFSRKLGCFCRIHERFFTAPKIQDGIR